MPLILLAGTVQSIRSDPFPPGDQRPRCECVIRADDALFRVLGFDEQITAMETLQPGDAVSVQGALMIETRQGKLAGLYVVAGQVMPLRKRSVSRAVAHAAA
jgi:hypothetical protein